MWKGVTKGRKLGEKEGISSIPENEKKKKGTDSSRKSPRTLRVGKQDEGLRKTGRGEKTVFKITAQKSISKKGADFGTFRRRVGSQKWG